MDHYIGGERLPLIATRYSLREVSIRSFGVGLLALATVAAATAASLLLRRRRPAAATAGRAKAVDPLYAAGL